MIFRAFEKNLPSLNAVKIHKNFYDGRIDAIETELGEYFAIDDNGTWFIYDCPFEITYVQ